jgi:phosphinothricin acetyltransferase
VDIRLARLRDAEAIRQIYNAEVLGSTVTFDLEPRSLAEQEAWLSERSGAHAVVVAEVDGEVVGFASLSPWRARPAYRTSVEDSVYVHADHRGRGIASALLGSILELAAMHGFHAVFARIVDGHDASIAVHTRHGFEVVGVEREVGRKFGRWLDVVVMELLLDGGRPKSDEPSGR